jgi:hypothetical protein
MVYAGILLGKFRRSHAHGGSVLRYLTRKIPRTAVLMALHDIRYSGLERGKFRCSQGGVALPIPVLGR